MAAAVRLAVTQTGSRWWRVPFILNAHYTITPSMVWSNIFAGAVAGVLSLAAFGETRRVPARW